jgi:hypothetical protein
VNDSGLDWQAVGVIVATVVAVGVALGGLLNRHTGKLSAIETAVKGLAKSTDQNRNDHHDMWDRLDEHGKAITKHGTKIAALECRSGIHGRESDDVHEP